MKPVSSIENLIPHPDIDPPFCHSDVLSKHDSKPSEYKKCTSDTAMLEGIMMENQNGALCYHNCETDTARLASEINHEDGYCNTPELEYIMVVEDCITGIGNKVRDAVAPCAVPSNKKELFERVMECHSDKNGIENEHDLEFREYIAPCAVPSRKMDMFDADPYTDKNVLDCGLPELIVCYKDDTYHAVKDICIDDGVPSKDKVLIECGEENGHCTILSSNGNQYGGLTQAEDVELLSSSGSKSSSDDSYEVEPYECRTKEEIELLSSSGSKSSSDNDPNEVDTDECRTKGIELLSPIGLKSSSDDCHEVDNHVCTGTKEIVEAEMQTSAENEFTEDIGNDCGYAVPLQTDEANDNVSDGGVDDVSREKYLTNRLSTHKSLKSLLESDCDTIEVGQESSQIPCSELPCETPSVISTSEESSKSNPTNNLSYNSKVESGTITFDFNSMKPAASKRDEIPNDTNLEHHLKIDTENKQDDEISDTLSVSSEKQLNQGETSFSMAAHPVSGLITYSGPIASSGSVSLRSDSSTTSIRSFAFPVLQSEWNSSPIRMTKADRRHYRRHRGVWQGLLCCRF